MQFQKAKNPGRAIITVTGKNRPGIVAAFSKILAQEQVDINDLSQKILDGDLFVMMIVGSLEQSRITLLQLRESLHRQGENMGLQVSVHHEKLFQYLNRI